MNRYRPDNLAEIAKAICERIAPIAGIAPEFERVLASIQEALRTARPAASTPTRTAT